jgi:hypothetical protein
MYLGLTKLRPDTCDSQMFHRCKEIGLAFDEKHLTYRYVTTRMAKNLVKLDNPTCQG